MPILYSLPPIHFHRHHLPRHTRTDSNGFPTPAQISLKFLDVSQISIRHARRLMVGQQKSVEPLCTSDSPPSLSLSVCFALLPLLVSATRPLFLRQRHALCFHVFPVDESFLSIYAASFTALKRVFSVQKRDRVVRCGIWRLFVGFRGFPLEQRVVECVVLSGELLMLISGEVFDYLATQGVKAAMHACEIFRMACLLVCDLG